MKKSQHIGYVRVSSEDQNPERQLEGVEVDKLYIEKVTGKDLKRPVLQDLLKYIREGDTLIVHSMDRLARDLVDLRQLVKKLTQEGITIRFRSENLIFTGEDAPMANLMLSMLGAFAEFERALIRERQREGIAIAKQKKLYKGRKPKLTEEQILAIYERFKTGVRKVNIAQEFNICRETLYKHFRKFQSLEKQF